MTVERALKEAGISVEVREYPLMYKETEVVIDTSKHDEEVRAEVIEELKSLLQIEYQKDNIDWSEMCVLNKVIKQLKEKR